ncbi:MAG: Phenylalanine--tRNA ligase beta subunit [Prochlorococcus marinus str. MIT 9215]|nr:MAG: Phenylalanine--tRNA ligase beta subunit [Prochlorococcus marinus str. MIT 9215]
MRVSLSWLQDLVGVHEPVELLAERLSMAGFEVESIEDLAKFAQSVVVGLVVDRQDHPNADKLSVCQVDIGADQNLQIVCGAANVRSGIHVPVAVVGAELPAVGLTIKASELRGVPSQGMICSLAELGLENDADGIAVLEEISDSLPGLGEPIGPVVGLDDTVMELAITANRPDGMSMVGIAREVAALTGSALTLPALKFAPEHETFSPEPSSELAMLDGGLYGLTSIENLDGSISSPLWLRRKLERAGLKSVNAVVDITNLVMLEQGQPLHAFDADALESMTGQPVTPENFGLRQAKEGEPFLGLDGRELELDERCQVVTCHDQAVALAGVMGSAQSGVTSHTRRIWLESAMFSPSAVRTTARALGLRTDASSRYEKGLPIEMTLVSAQRASTLMAEHLDAKAKGCWVCGQANQEQEPIHLRRQAIHQLLGPLNEGEEVVLQPLEGDLLSSISSDLCQNDLDDETIQDALTALGCVLSTNDTGWSVEVPPSRRKDLLREVDLIEEVARLVGFDRFQAHLPDPLAPGELTPTQKAERILRKLLCGAGFQEVTTLSLVGADAADPERIAISNPLLAETSHLRTNLWEEHLRVCQRNLKSSQPGCWLFELGNVYTSTTDGINQTSLLGGAICAERRLECWTNNGKPMPLNYFQARGQLAQALLGLKLNIVDKPLHDDQNLHPGRAASLWVEGKPVGKFGQLHPSLSDKYDLPESTYIYSLDLAILLQAATRSNRWTVAYQSFPTVPSMERDLAVVVSKDCASSNLINSIRKAGKPLLEHVELIDRFEGGQLENDRCSQAFRLRYRAKDSTLTDEQVQPVHEKVRQALVKQFSAELRS